MSSVDELFLNGQIIPMKLSSHLQRPQILSPLLDLNEDEEHEEEEETAKNACSDSLHRGRDLKLRSRSLHRKARSLSPLRNAEFQWLHHEEDNDKAKHVDKEDKQSEMTLSCSASSSRSSSVGRNSSSPTAHCSFSGVLCDKDSRVVSLTVTSTPLYGFLPPEIGLLDRLVNLTISGYNLTGK
jgi:hypothetical protein